MHHGPGLVVVTSLLAAGLVAAYSHGLGLAYPQLRSHLTRVGPESRARLLCFVAGLPWMLALETLLLTFLPSFITIPNLIEDHCLPHSHHPHLCLRHGLWAPSWQAWTLLAALGLAGGALCLRWLHRILAGQRQIRTLLRFGKTTENFHLLPSPRILAFSAGLLRPCTVMSSGALSSLEERDLKVVLIHEAAHAQRRDALRLVLGEALLMAVPDRLRRMLIEDLALACEESCDRAALPHAGGPERMAEILMRVQRLGMVSPKGLPGVTGSQLSLRVRALLEESYPPSRTWIWATPLLLLLATPVHHSAETLLHILIP